MENVFMIDKTLMLNIIETLKNLDVRGWKSIDALVGCVLMLEQAMEAPPSTTKTETGEINLSQEE